MYGFHKVNDLIHSNLTNENQTWEFKHPNFRKGAVGDLQHIKRKSAKTQQLQLQQQLQQQAQQAQAQQQPQQQQQQLQYNNNNFNNNSNNLNNSNDYTQQQQQQQTSSNIKDEDNTDNNNINNPVISHILRIEQHLLGVTKSCESLFNEVVHLRMVVSKQQDVSSLYLF